MPNVRPPTTGTGALAGKLHLVAGSSWVDYGLMAALTFENVDRLEKLAEAGAAGLSSS